MRFSTFFLVFHSFFVVFVVFSLDFYKGRIPPNTLQLLTGLFAISGYSGGASGKCFGLFWAVLTCFSDSFPSIFRSKFPTKIDKHLNFYEFFPIKIL